VSGFFSNSMGHKGRPLPKPLAEQKFLTGETRQ